MRLDMTKEEIRKLVLDECIEAMKHVDKCTKEGTSKETHLAGDYKFSRNHYYFRAILDDAAKLSAIIDTLRSAVNTEQEDKQNLAYLEAMLRQSALTLINNDITGCIGRLTAESIEFDWERSRRWLLDIIKQR
jgi:hypothetical protein